VPILSCLSVRSLLQTKLVCYKLTKATLRASLSSSLLEKCDGGNAPLASKTDSDERYNSF
jgi:hypothetical protein